MTTHIQQLGPQAAWDFLAAHEDALLVDVRTEGEWKTGVTATPNIAFVEWVSFPLGIQNKNFLNELRDVASEDTPLLFLCKAGVRSQAAAEFASANGFTSCHNITGGMSGNGNDIGWAESGLPVGVHN